MSAPEASVIVPTLGGERLGRMLASVASPDHETIVVDNGSGGSVAAASAGLPGVEVVELDRNVGYTRAINLGVRRARGERIVLLNDDCVVRPGLRRGDHGADRPGGRGRDGRRRDARLARPIADRQRRDGARPDPAGLRLPERRAGLATRRRGRRTRSARRPRPPRSIATTFLSVGGFDERLFAYWEDVDLVLRLRRLGLRCALAPTARGDHEHSATLGSGSARKNYLMGYGRGYLLRKWGVLTPRRLPAVLARELALCAGPGGPRSQPRRGPRPGAGLPRGDNPAALPGRARAASARRGRSRRCAAAPRGAGACGPRRRRPAGCARSPSSTSPTRADPRARSRPSSPGSPARGRSTSSPPEPGTSGRCSATGRR